MIFIDRNFLQISNCVSLAVLFPPLAYIHSPFQHHSISCNLILDSYPQPCSPKKHLPTMLVS